MQAVGRAAKPSEPRPGGGQDEDVDGWEPEDWAVVVTGFSSGVGGATAGLLHEAGAPQNGHDVSRPA